MLAHRFRLAALASWGLALGHAPPATAQTRGDTLLIDEAVAEALRASPQVRSARLRAETQAERGVQVGALPDPMLSLGLMNRPFDFGTGEPMTMNQIQISQSIPWAGKRSSATAREEGLARAADMEAAEVSASVVAMVRTLYYRMAYIDRAIDVMQETRRILADLQQTASTLYSVGSAAQQDVLRAQVAEIRMDADIVVMQQERIAAAARFNALLGRRPDVPIGPLQLREPVGPIPELDALVAMAERRPAVRAARARVEAATAQRDVADRAHLPDVNLMVGYSQRPSFDDMVSVMVAVPIPVRRGSVQEPLRRESEVAEAAAQSEALDVYNETYATLAERRAQAVRAAEVADLLRAEVLPQAQAAVESGLSAYRVGRLDFMAVLESQMLVNQFEIERLSLAADYQSAVAWIDALIGVIPGGVQ